MPTWFNADFSWGVVAGIWFVWIGQMIVRRR